MKLGSVFVYYNPEWGYIIAADTTIKDSVMRVTINPVHTEKIDITKEQLGKSVFAGLEKSRKAMPVERKDIKDFKFWQITGIKGFATFSKKFKCVEVLEKEKMLKIRRLIRQSDGSYSWIKDDKGIEIFISESEEHIGQLVYNMFYLDENNETKERNTVFFQSVNENKVIYKRPSDNFIDIGDGHTDAYQIYKNENDQKSYIAFLIDNGYSEISNDGIQKRWEQIYGKIKEYHFEEKNGELLKILVSAKTRQSNVRAYFYQDGEDLLEVLTEISNNIPEIQRLEIEKEINDIIDSISIG